VGGFKFKSDMEHLLHYSEIAPNGVCWLWTGHLSDDGYGLIKVGGRKGKTLVVSRLSWALFMGPIPDGKQVLHRCDVRHCFNPFRCLFLETPADNMADKVAKGRQSKGSVHATVRSGAGHWTSKNPARKWAGDNHLRSTGCLIP